MLLQVTVISRGRPADLPEGEEAGCTFRHVDGSTTMASSYANAGLATADAVIIGAARVPPAALFGSCLDAASSPTCDDMTIRVFVQVNVRA
jgi:hypothetical protein